MKKGELSYLSKEGARISVRVTPKASRNEVTLRDGKIRIQTTTAPENGKANKAVAKLLAEALGTAKSRLELIQGATSKDKVFQIKA
ncbi:hypothetical protein SAMN04488030_2238 [Aliiroseovarius halocynthiae]|uniref:UPF0235 protein FIL88_00745 n=1 Tax=Aliiroseovarius halocynthiae TaxID=985055 RepID=A0A545SZS4_9RHOB|nr:DUF167 domain-containing protein [Aliiroseovarius halocynthiae]TQV70463.1 DUF167 domain-containing protein [Aliiroseovarius halocynthiae]SMR81816.1 hypothetical protein SAMN04488030_2238 [Aliiroseovarius halocynthiae]